MERSQFPVGERWWTSPRCYVWAKLRPKCTSSCKFGRSSIGLWICKRACRLKAKLASLADADGRFLKTELLAEKSSLRMVPRATTVS